MSNAESAAWYYARAGQQLGPVPFEQLRALAAVGQLAQGDLVWCDGQPDWQPAASVPGLFAGVPVGLTPAAGMLQYQAPLFDATPYVGFGRRFVAYLIDYVLTTVVGFVLGAAVGFVIGVAGSGAQKQNAVMIGIQAVTSALGLIFGWLYGALMESSSTQGTLGKMAMGIKVTDESGGRITFGRATGRHFGKILSGIILGIGFLMILWSPRKQGLHDQLAHTLVLSKGPAV